MVRTSEKKPPKNQDYLIEIMGLIGFTIAQLQRVESALAASWLLYARLENEDVAIFVFDGDFKELRQRNSKKVLGRFLTDVRTSGQFKTSFNKRFQKFVDNRNRLVHRIFKERSYFVLRNKKTLQRLHRFVSGVFRDAVFFEKVFDAHLGVSFRILAKNPDYFIKGLDQVEKIMAEKHSRGEIDLLSQSMKKHL